MASPRKSGKFYHPKCGCNPGSYHTLEGASPRIELGDLDPPESTAKPLSRNSEGQAQDGKTLKNHMKSEILSQVHTQEMTKKSKKSPPSKP
jgi:hypothetical protein